MYIPQNRHLHSLYTWHCKWFSLSRLYLCKKCFVNKAVRLILLRIYKTHFPASPWALAVCNWSNSCRQSTMATTIVDGLCMWNARMTFNLQRFSRVHTLHFAILHISVAVGVDSHTRYPGEGSIFLYQVYKRACPA